MHELSIAMSLIDMAGEEAQQRAASRVNAIHLRLGSLSGVVEDALRSSFDIAKSGSPLDQTSLVIEHVPVTAFCEYCGEACPVQSIQQMCCRYCGTPCGDVVTGQELEVTALEISDDNANATTPHD